MDSENNIKNILVVDDSPTVRTIVRSYLEKMGHNVIERNCGEDALDYLEHNLVDLILLDVEMAGMNGYETSAKISDLVQKKGITIPIIMLTSIDTYESRTKGFESGVTDYLTKPVSFSEMDHAVGNILNPQHGLKDVKVLLVDDSDTTRMVIRNFLSQHSATVIEAKSGEQAIELLREFHYNFDIIILDIYLEDMQGFEICRYIREKTILKKVPVIFLSGASNMEDVLEVYNSGGSDYINKPFIKDELVAKLKIHYDSYRYGMAMKNILREQKEIDKMKDEFLSVCSHDLRSPLSGMLGLTSLLIEEELTAEQKESLEYIKSAGESLMGMIEDLLAVTNPLYLTNMKFEKTSLNQVLDSTGKLYFMASKLKGIELVWDNPCADIYINANGDALARVFGNLLSNAIKFNNSGGKIEMHLKQEEDMAIVEISDSGLGMTREQITQLFNKYSSFGKGTTGEKSTGLGLFIVKTFTKVHNGKIIVKSVPGKGSTFMLHFPLAK